MMIFDIFYSNTSFSPPIMFKCTNTFATGLSMSVDSTNAESFGKNHETRSGPKKQNPPALATHVILITFSIVRHFRDSEYSADEVSEGVHDPRLDAFQPAGDVRFIPAHERVSAIFDLRSIDKEIPSLAQSWTETDIITLGRSAYQRKGKPYSRLRLESFQ